MRLSLRTLGIPMATLLMGSALAISAAVAADKPQSFTGQISDAMCGASHMMEGTAAGCTRACVAKGSKYALIVGDKVYTLDAKDKAALDQLDKLAGAAAKVTGTANGDSIEVTSVAPGK
jgi:hypothetical protein